MVIIMIFVVTSKYAGERVRCYAERAGARVVPVPLPVHLAAVTTAKWKMRDNAVG